MNPNELQDLLDDYLDGSLDEAGLARLEALLLADAGARAHFVRYCRLHTDLYLEARARQASNEVLRALDEEVSPPPPRARRWLGWGAVAASLLAALGLGWWLLGRPGERPEAEVAWLVNAQDCRWAGDGPGPMVPGAVLSLDAGLAELRFRAGARVVLEGPARLAVLSATSARLERGKLAARVPDSASGFVVYSPRGRVVDLGTEFGVSVAEDGTTSVRVYEGEVIAAPAGQKGGAELRLRRDQSARIDAGGVRREEARPFVRAIVPPPAIVPRNFTLDFRRAVPGTMEDAAGQGTGFTHRLPGTGMKLNRHDANLRLDAGRGQLELTTTNSDVNRQVGMPRGEYFGVRLADLGFTGKEDFAVSVSIPNIPALRRVGQFGLYAGTRSNRNIRGGLISRKDEGLYTLFFVNNNGGIDRDSHFVGLLTTGDDTRLLLARKAGKYSLTVENRTTGSSSTLAIRHPDFLDRERDIHVGVFGANTQSQVSRTIILKDFRATVWTISPGVRPGKEVER
jgi:hypothetical protein